MYKKYLLKFKGFENLITLPIAKTLSVKNARAWVSTAFTYNEKSTPISIEKIKVLRAVMELPAKQHC